MSAWGSRRVQSRRETRALTAADAVPGSTLRALVRDPSACLGLTVVGALSLAALAAPLLAPYDPLQISAASLEKPGLRHLLGTDLLGRDVFSRILYGARLSMGSAALAAVLVMTIGLAVGAVAGYFGGLLDTVLMRLVDVILAFPGLVLALAIAGLFEPGVLTVMLGLVTIWWVGYARIVRGLVLSMRERPFVQAAVISGAGDLRILLTHIVPNVLPPLLVLLTLEMGQLILAIAGLSFLGLGAQPPTPEWGAMLNEGRSYLLSSSVHLILAPGAAISLVVLGFNLVGDGLRDALDPRSPARAGRGRRALAGARQAPGRASTPADPHVDPELARLVP